jgi:hypothetical protein
MLCGESVLGDLIAQLARKLEKCALGG